MYLWIHFGLVLQVSASLIRLTGTIRFENNTVDTLRGGALFITILGQIQMMRESRMEFIRNKGRCVCNYHHVAVMYVRRVQYAIIYNHASSYV